MSASSFDRKAIAREVFCSVARVANRFAMIRNKRDVLRASPNDHAGEHENIFIAKVCDSESANSDVNYVARLAPRLLKQEMHRA